MIVDPETGELAHRNNIFCFDVLNAEFRQWWVDTVAKGVAESGSDGVFIDQMHGFSWLRSAQSREVQQAMGAMMGALKKKMGPNKILVGNNAHQKSAKHVFPVIDASMFEHYNEKLLSKERLLRDWKDMLKIAKAGKISIFRIRRGRTGRPRYEIETRTVGNGCVGGREARVLSRLDRCQPYSYFQYGWGWSLSSGSLHEFPLAAQTAGTAQGSLDEPLAKVGSSLVNLNTHRCG